MYYKISLLSLLVLIMPPAKAQKLFTMQVSDEEKKAGVLAKYAYNDKEAYGYIGLTLYANNRFHYQLATFSRQVHSDGKWFRKKDRIVLESTIKPYDLPVKLVYINHDSAARGPGNNFLFRIEDPHGKLITDALVYVNSDSVRCLPMAANCVGSYSTIDSVKVDISKGPESKWIKVLKKDYKQLLLVVEVDFDLTAYDAFERREYRVIKSGLELIQ